MLKTLTLSVSVYEVFQFLAQLHNDIYTVTD